jgi:hypothetical protein
METETTTAPEKELTLQEKFRAVPDVQHTHGVAQLSSEGRPLATDAGYFPTQQDAALWAESRGWLVYELKQVVGL